MGDEEEIKSVASRLRKNASDNCMGVSLSIRKPPFRVKCDEKSRKLEEEDGMAQGTASVTVGMTPEEKATSGMKCVTSIKSQVEKVFYEYAKPAGKKGDWMLNFSKAIKPCAIVYDKRWDGSYEARLPHLVVQQAGESIEDFEKRIGERSISVFTLVDNAMKDGAFLFEGAIKVVYDNYDSIVANAQANGIYNSKDYPPLEELKQKFGFNFTKHPISQNQMELFESIHGYDDANALFEEFAEKHAEILQKQNDNVLKDLILPVHKFIESNKAKNSDESTAMYESIVGNLLRGVSAVRVKSSDPELEKICDMIEATIASRDVDDLKDKKEEREDALAEALTIEQKIEEYVQDVGNNMGISF